MRPLISPIQTTVERQKKIPSPKLIWPSICLNTKKPEDLWHTPEKIKITERFKHGENKNLLGSTEFWDCATHAEEIRIIDSHLDESAIKAIRELLWSSTGLKMLHIICSTREKDAVKTIFDDLCIGLKELGCKGSLEMKQVLDKNPYPPIHDRFALIDDELWHCGSTVGGLHHKLTALSRGWSDEQHKFKEFFDNVWAMS